MRNTFVSATVNAEAARPGMIVSLAEIIRLELDLDNASVGRIMLLPTSQ